MQVAVQPTPVVATFEVLAIANPQKSKEAGRPIYDEQEVCRVRFAGNKHTVGVFPAHEVFTQKADESGFVQPITYAMEYKDAYLKFKGGEAQTMAGTPLSELPFLSAGKRLELKALNIHTAETLAGLDGHPLKMLGMNGRELKNQAIAYLETASATKSTAQLNEALEIRDREIAELREQIAALAAGGILPVKSDKSSVFSDFSDDDLTNWIKDADPGAKIDGRWQRAKLIEVADEINARLAKKAVA